MRVGGQREEGPAAARAGARPTADRWPGTRRRSRPPSRRAADCAAGCARPAPVSARVTPSAAACAPPVLASTGACSAAATPSPRAEYAPVSPKQYRTLIQYS